MKTYEEMTKSVMEKAEIHKEIRRVRRRNTAVALTTCACCLALAAISGGMLKDASNSDRIPTTGNSVMQSVQVHIEKDEVTAPEQIDTQPEAPVVNGSKPRITLLCAASNGATPKAMVEKIKIPRTGELRVSNIAGMTEAEKHQLGKDEAVYIAEMWGELADESGYGRYMLDNVMVTTISVGEFGIKMDDVDMVSRIRISVTENGVLISYPRVEGCKTSAYTFEGDQQLLIDIDGKSLKECLVQNERDTLGLFWHISPWAVTKLDKDPDMDLSLFSDEITIQIDYTDGRTERSVIHMLVDSSGQISAVLEGTEIRA